LVEADSEKALRSLFVSVAEEVLSAGEVDDDEILEARVDKIESKIEEKAITIPGLAQMIEDENIAANKFFEEEDTGILIVEEDDHQVSVALSEIPLAAEQYYRVTENKSPCGEEDRLPCDDSSEFPHSAICYLIMRKSFGRESRGTGFFISPDTIVTAGHCLRSGWGRVRSIEVIPGRMGADMPFGSAFAKRWFVPQQWSRGGDVRFDYGAIKMSDASLGEQTGYLPIDVLSDDEILQKMITTSGYPSDMPISTNQHFNSGECDDVQEQRLVYSLDTWKGASGSPVWVELDGKRVVIGIHNYGHCPNRATRVNRRVFEDLERWVKS
jgi:V8-like Glu-specific endopeptidase